MKQPAVERGEGVVHIGMLLVPGNIGFVVQSMLTNTCTQHSSTVVMNINMYMYMYWSTCSAKQTQCFLETKSIPMWTTPPLNSWLFQAGVAGHTFILYLSLGTVYKVVLNMDMYMYICSHCTHIHVRVHDNCRTVHVHVFSFYQRKKETVSSVSGRSTKECTPVACGDAMLTLSAKLPALMFHVDEDKVSSMVLEDKASWQAVWIVLNVHQC